MMCCGDVLVNRVVGDEEVLSALNQLFSASTGEILVVDDIASPNLNLSSRVKVVCEKRSIKGDFPNVLSFYVHDQEIKQLDEQRVVKQLCALLKCRCLTSDDSDNPYTWLLTQADVKPRRVSLDPELLDNEEAYVIR